jgi:hypothetical protein
VVTRTVVGAATIVSAIAAIPAVAAVAAVLIAGAVHPRGCRAAAVAAVAITFVAITPVVITAVVTSRIVAGVMDRCRVVAAVAGKRHRGARTGGADRCRGEDREHAGRTNECHGNSSVGG